MSYSGAQFRNPFGFTITPWVKRLLIANGVAFLITLALPALVPYLAFTPAAAWFQPWTAVTYMFLHAGVFHLLFNMLVLFFFGPPLEDRWGSAEFVKFYLICGLGGALLSIPFWDVRIVGASAAIYGVMVAFALYWPDNPIYIWGIFPVKAKWLVGGLVALSVFFTVTGGSPGIAHLAHLGGAAAAFGYLKSSWGPSPFGSPVQKRRRPRTTVSRASAEPERETRARKRAAQLTTGQEKQLLDDIDRILDKISERGLDSLTSDERKRLDEASRKFRTD